MTNNKKFRHEFKYWCSQAQLSVLEGRLSALMKHDKHAIDGQYSIRSMYFDNYNNRCFYENENGVSPREKYRIRIYNASSDRISLECKRKEGDKTYKTSCLLSINDYNQILNGGSFDNFNEKPEVLKKFLLLQRTQLFKPAVIVEYERTPYIYETGNVRITLDMNIRSSTDFSQFFSSDLFTREIMPKGQHLLEVKYDELLPDYIRSVLEIGALQRTTFSKYYLCRKYSLGGKL